MSLNANPPPPPTKGGRSGVGGQNFKSPGNVMNCRENRYIFFYPPPPGGNFRGSKKQKSGKCHERPRKVTKKCPVSATPQNGCGFFASCKHCARLPFGQSVDNEDALIIKVFPNLAEKLPESHVAK